MARSIDWALAEGSGVCAGAARQAARINPIARKRRIEWLGLAWAETAPIFNCFGNSCDPGVLHGIPKPVQKLRFRRCREYP
jgi:hypothetical protein